MLGNLTDDGPEFSPTATHPNLYGYINPYSYLDHSLTQLSPVGVTVSGNQIVRTGPDSATYTTVVTNVSSGQEFAAFAAFNGWYQIFLPSTHGPAVGWIQATPNASAVLLRVDNPVQSATGVNVRPSPSTAQAPISKVWDRQLLVRAGPPSGGNGCSAVWPRIHLASNAPASLGWSCGEFIDVLCDSIDFNNDSSVFDPQDIEAFLSAYSEAPCVPSGATCGDIDFNNDTSLFDPCDINSFLVMYSEGPCTPCGQ